MTTFGYIRTSRILSGEERGMNPDAQRRRRLAQNITPADIHQGLGISGARTPDTRPGWSALSARLRPGDQIVITALDRRSRSRIETLAIIRALREKQVALISLRDTESWVTEHFGSTDPTTGLVAELLLQVSAWAAEQELITLRHRIRAGMEQAGAEGRHPGRSSITTPEIRQLIHRMRRQGVSNRAIARNLRISRRTVARILDEETPAPAGNAPAAPHEPFSGG